MKKRWYEYLPGVRVITGQAAGEIPAFYGLAWYVPVSDRVVLAVIPLNLALRLGYSARGWLKRGRIPKDSWDKHYWEKRIRGVEDAIRKKEEELRGERARSDFFEQKAHDLREALSASEAEVEKLHSGLCAPTGEEEDHEA
jgi:hypothetical protein